MNAILFEPPVGHRRPRGMERVMMARLPLWASLLGAIVACGLAIGLAAIVRYPTGWRRLDTAAADLADIPRTLKLLLVKRPRWRPYYGGDHAPLPGGFHRNAVQPFVDPGYLLLTAFDERLKRPVVRLLRLSDGVVAHQFAPAIDTVNARSRFRSALIDLPRDRDARHNLMMHPLLMPDGGLLIHDTGPLARVDACGRIEWVEDGIFHHSIEQAPDGLIWAAYRYPVAREPRVAATFDDEAIVAVSPSGRVVRRARIADILDRNGLGRLWRARPYTDDPFHLNDVQPVPGSGRYWRAGDLLISLRNLSLILLYRPSTGRVLWSRSGPWTMQHDVSVLDEHRITIFDNNWRIAAPEGEVDGRNRVPVYDFATGRVTYPYAAAIARFAIRTRAQGRATPLPNGDIMIEETERGRLLRLAPDGTARWEYIATDRHGRRLQLRWSRYLDPRSQGAAIAAAIRTNCA